MKIKKEILEVLQKSIFKEPSTLVLCGDLDRKTYLETNKVLESLGLKWNRKEKAHISSIDISEKWYNLIDTGEWVDVKSEYQFFPTPSDIVDKMINMVDWSLVESCLEPSFGTRNILDKIKSPVIIGCELNSEMFNEASVKYSGVESYVLFNQDFLTLENIKVDCIIANPPFTKLQSIKHFFHMVNLLNDGGQLVCILPFGDYDKNSSIKLRQEFSNFIDDNDCEVTYLDSGDFKESGTMVKTIIVKYCRNN